MGIRLKEEVEVLLSRAEKFLRDARFDYENHDYDLAMFHIEQAVQLMVKAKLLEIKGYYGMRAIRRLILELSEVYSGEELRKFIDENKTALRNLERAYITSRYLIEEFFREEVDDAFRAAERLRVLLWSG